MSILASNFANRQLSRITSSFAIDRAKTHFSTEISLKRISLKLSFSRIDTGIFLSSFSSKEVESQTSPVTF